MTSLKDILEDQERRTRKATTEQDEARQAQPKFDNQFKIVLLYRNLRDGYRKLNYGLDGNLSPALQLLFWVFVMIVVVSGIMGGAR